MWCRPPQWSQHEVPGRGLDDEVLSPLVKSVCFSSFKVGLISPVNVLTIWFPFALFTISIEIPSRSTDCETFVFPMEVCVLFPGKVIPGHLLLEWVFMMKSFQSSVFFSRDVGLNSSVRFGCLGVSLLYLRLVLQSSVGTLFLENWFLRWNRKKDVLSRYLFDLATSGLCFSSMKLGQAIGLVSAVAFTFLGLIFLVEV